MTTPTRMPALGAAAWISEEDGAALIGSRCTSCEVIAFPPVTSYCPNPKCGSRDHVSIRLGSTGTVWSYTNAAYRPPPPYVSDDAEFSPFGIVAVELEAEGLVVLGQLVQGADIAELRIGDPVELVIEPLYVDAEGVERTTWKWRPTHDR